MLSVVKDQLANLVRALRKSVFFFFPHRCFFFSVVGVGKFSPSTVADLVYDLVKLASLLTNFGDDRARAVQHEVANCLGEIGAVDLSTVSLGSKKRGMIYRE